MSSKASSFNLFRGLVISKLKIFRIALKAEIEKRKQRIEHNLREIQRLDEIISKLSVVFEIRDKATQAVLRKGFTGVYGTISQLMKTQPKYAIAIEVAASGHMNDIVTKNEDVAIECIKYLKQNKIGRATFLPLNKIKQKPLPVKPNVEGVIDFAINLIEFDKKYLPAFSFVFGDTLVVENLEVAKKIGFGKYRYVTLDGDLVEKSSAIIGGFYKEKPLASEEISRYEAMKKEIEAGWSREDVRLVL